MKLVAYAFLTAMLATSPMALANTDKTVCDTLLAELITVGDAPDFEFKGISEKGLKRVDAAAEGLAHTETAYNQMIEGQEMILDTHLITMATGQNHLILGPPGAAKTMGIDFLFNNSIWTKQVTEWTTPFEIFGGQTEEGLRKGKEDINTDGSALKAKYVLIDEINNANPQLLGSLLSYLNPGERRISINGIQMKGETRSIFSTGNATRAEILNSFLERQLQSGPATLNRYAFKSFVYNWRPAAQQARLDDVYKRVERLKFLAKNGSSAQQTEAKKFLERISAKNIDVELVETLGTNAFVPSDLLESTLREFIDAFRIKMNSEKMKSKTAAKDDPSAPIFEPSTEWTERIRSTLMKVIRYSAALDLLRLDAKVRNQLLKKPIELSPLSMWRVVNLAITNTEGIAFFDLPEAKMQFNLVKQYTSDGKDIQLEPLDIETLKAQAGDPREQQQWTDIELEQTAFNDILSEHLKATAKTNEAIAALLNPDGDVDLDLESSDFEFYVYGQRWAKIAKTLRAKKATPAATTATPSN